MTEFEKLLICTLRRLAMATEMLAAETRADRLGADSEDLYDGSGALCKFCGAFAEYAHECLACDALHQSIS